MATNPPMASTDLSRLIAVKPIVEALFEDLRDRRFLKWLFTADNFETPILHMQDGEPLMPLEADVQEEIRATWAQLIANNLRPILDAAESAAQAIADRKKVEAERDELRTYAHEATKAITGLTIGGSEYFGKKIGEIYTADLPLCVQRIRDRDERSHARLLKAVAERKAAERERDEALSALAARDEDLAQCRGTAFEECAQIADELPHCQLTHAGRRDPHEAFDVGAGAQKRAIAAAIRARLAGGAE
jgi:hypothetical protein